MQWVSHRSDMPDDVHVTYGDIGAGLVDHNLMCYLCNERSAMWYGNPVWLWGPCEHCRSLLNILDFADLVAATERKRQPSIMQRIRSWF